MDLYIISIEMDEESIYFSELTPNQAEQLRKILKKGHWNYSVKKIRNSPGFNSFQDLKATFEDMVTP